MDDSSPSDEILNAFVDGEFSPEDRLNTLQFIAANERLSREICDRVQLKELVGLAYRPDVLPKSRGAGLNGSRALFFGAGKLAAAGIAGVALLLVFLLAVQHEADVWSKATDPVVASAEYSSLLLPASLSASERRVLLHVTDLGVGDADTLFNDIEFLFEDARQNGRNLFIQVVIHGDSMDLVRADLSPFSLRIRELVETYPGLRLTACGQSRAQISRGQGRPMELLPWVEEVESGIREAALKQLEGWAYIRL